MLETMEHFFLDQSTPLQSDGYRIGRRATRSSTRDEEAALEEGIEALGAHLSFAEHQFRSIADALGDGPPVTLETFVEEPVAPGEYQLFVSNEIHDILHSTAADARLAVVDEAVYAVEVDATSNSEPSSPGIATNNTVPVASAHTPSAAAMFRAAAAAAASPSTVVGPRSRRRYAPAPSAPQQRTRSSKQQEPSTFDSYSVASEDGDSFDAAFDEINIELTEVNANERYTTVITAVAPASPVAVSNNKRRSTSASTPNKRNGSSTPGKRGRRTNTTVTVIERQTNYLEEKSGRSTGSFAGEEVLRISSVVIEETDVDILN